MLWIKFVWCFWEECCLVDVVEFENLCDEFFKVEVEVVVWNVVIFFEVEVLFVVFRFYVFFKDFLYEFVVVVFMLGVVDYFVVFFWGEYISGKNFFWIFWVFFYVEGFDVFWIVVDEEWVFEFFS